MKTIQKKESLINQVVLTIMVLMLIDIAFFCLWIASGQAEPEGFYFGRFTREVVSLIIK